MSDDQNKTVDNEIKELREPLLSDDELVKLVEQDFAQADSEAHESDELAKQRVWQGVQKRIKGPRSQQKLMLPGVFALAAAVALIVFLGDRFGEDTNVKSGGEVQLQFSMTPMMVDTDGEIVVLPSDEPPADVKLVISLRPGADGFASLMGVRQGDAETLLTDVPLQAHSEELLGDGDDAYIFSQPADNLFGHLCVLAGTDREQLSTLTTEFLRDPVRGLAKSQCLRLGSSP